MESLELPLGLGLAVLIVAVALFYAIRQAGTIRQLQGDGPLSDADRHHLRMQVMRRLIISGLLILIAGFLVGSFFLAEPTEPAPAGAPNPDQQWQDARSFASYWLVVLVALLAIIALAVMDLWATARYGWRHFKQLESDRQAMLEEEAARLRYRRHEMN